MSRESKAEHFSLTYYDFDNVIAQSGSLEERAHKANLPIAREVLENFDVKDYRKVLNLRLVRIPQGMTASQVWERIKTDPEFQGQPGFCTWELTGAEHTVALHADSRLGTIFKNKGFGILATRSHRGIWEKRIVPCLAQWKDGDRKQQEAYLNRSLEGDFLLLVRTADN